jgi:hypothetical protein
MLLVFIFIGLIGGKLKPFGIRPLLIWRDESQLFPSNAGAIENGIEMSGKPFGEQGLFSHLAELGSLLFENVAGQAVSHGIGQIEKLKGI